MRAALPAKTPETTLVCPVSHSACPKKRKIKLSVSNTGQPTFKCPEPVNPKIKRKHPKMTFGLDSLPFSNFLSDYTTAYRTRI
eukprot:6197309-Pleurochrysis_carterae.AAC.6